MSWNRRLLYLLGLSALLVTARPGSARGTDQQTALWAGNLGGETIEVQVKHSWDRNTQTETLSLRPGEVVRLERWAPRETLDIGGHQDLFLISAPVHFDAAGVEVQAQENLEPAERPAAEFDKRPSRGRGLGVLKAAANAGFARGQEASAATVWGGAGAMTVSLSLRARSSVDLQLKRADGVSLGFVGVSAKRPLALKIDLSSLLAKAGYRGALRTDLKVLSGRAEAALASAQGETVRFQAIPVFKQTGTAVFDPQINWSWNPTLYYRVTGGPANTYGDSFVDRNHLGWTVTYGWLRTDGSGNSTKGPWSWYSDTADEYAEAYIRWQSDWSTTNTDWHIWDRNCPSISVTSPGGSPPLSFQGTASDGSNGAGFNANWSSSWASFRDTTNGQYWNGSSYGSPGEFNFGCFISGMPSHSVGWSCPVPPATAHVTGRCYAWKACIYDGGCDQCTTINFCK